MAADERSCLPGRSVVGFQDLPRQVGRLFTCKECSRYHFLPVGLGGLTQIKIYEIVTGGVLCGCWEVVITSVLDEDPAGTTEIRVHPILAKSH